VLAGGVGSRFWPVSTHTRPKQLLPLTSDRPLIVETVERARSLTDDAHIRILAGEHLVAPFRRAVPDLPEASYLVEPRARGTCPVLAWAAAEIVRVDPDAVLVSLHADHLVHPLPAFQDTVRVAAQLAREHERLVTIGVPPDRVETGFGHIQLGAPIDVRGGAAAFHVAAFHEKPNADTARAYMDAGYVWNTGIFVWRAATFLEEVRRHAPQVAGHLPALEHDGAEAFFRDVPPCVVDTEVLERSDRVACVQATFTWDDVGSWEALARTHPLDAQGNVVVGDGSVVDGSGNIVFSEDGRVVLFGIEDCVVVQSGPVTLVTPRTCAPDLKRLLRALGEEA
jgi:mannose-1-phosphate guanylyltransferase